MQAFCEFSSVTNLYNSINALHHTLNSSQKEGSSTGCYQIPLIPPWFLYYAIN